jgi:hypothetical protein
MNCWTTEFWHNRGNPVRKSHHWSSEMIPKVVSAEYIEDYVINIKFSDGTQGHVDFEGELYGELFEPLKDVTFFKRFAVHPDFHTLYWPNGADFAPEYLYEKVKLTV